MTASDRKHNLTFPPHIWSLIWRNTTTGKTEGNFAPFPWLQQCSVQWYAPDAVRGTYRGRVRPMLLRCDRKL